MSETKVAISKKPTSKGTDQFIGRLNMVQLELSEKSAVVVSLLLATILSFNLNTITRNPYKALFTWSLYPYCPTFKVKDIFFK